MKITDYMVDKPCTVICASYAILIFFAALTGAFGYMMPVLEGSRNREFLIWKHPLQVDYDKLDLAEEYVTNTKGDAVVDLQTESSNFIFLLYSQTGEQEYGLLNKDVLKKVKVLEDGLLENEEFKKFCLAIVPTNKNDPPVCDKDKVYSALSSILSIWQMNPALGIEIPIG